MKTFGYLSITLGLFVLAACSSNHRMVTHIHPDGKLDREIYAYGDSAFMAGDLSSSPFLFSIQQGWQLIPLDSNIPYVLFEKKEKLYDKEDILNVKVKRTWNIWKDSPCFTAKKESLEPLAVPQEKLEKKFKWFYTYYTFTCNYRQIEDKGPVPMDRYLSEREQKLLFQGDQTGYSGMNGIELTEILDRLTDSFMKWYYDSQYEISYEIISQQITQSGNTTFTSRLQADKDSIKIFSSNGKEEIEYSPKELCPILDSFYHTQDFSALYRNKKDQIDSRFEEKCRTLELFGNQIKYELEMPGKLITANTSLREGEMLYWKVDAYRLLPSDYILTAQSRIPNIWAFVVTGIFGLLALCGLLYSRRRK